MAQLLCEMEERVQRLPFIAIIYQLQLTSTHSRTIKTCLSVLIKIQKDLIIGGAADGKNVALFVVVEEDCNVLHLICFVHHIELECTCKLHVSRAQYFLNNTIILHYQFHRFGV